MAAHNDLTSQSAWSALTLIPSHPDLLVGCLLPPPHKAYPLMPTWGPSAHSLHGDESLACLTTTEHPHPMRQLTGTFPLSPQQLDEPGTIFIPIYQMRDPALREGE